MSAVTPEARILFGEDEIRRRVGELGTEIGRAYAGRSPLMITVLKGAVVFLADLIRATDLPVGLDFMSISSYGGSGRAAGVVRILKDLDEDITGRDVIVVEDIIDTGLTLSYLLGILRTRGPASVEVCTLLDRSVRRIAPIELRWVGFDLPDVFVVGYGLDHQGKYRNLPFIVAVDRQATLDDHPELLAAFEAEASVASPSDPA
jgi:hypoxanthine phosphoribosyltransferase